MRFEFIVAMKEVQILKDMAPYRFVNSSVDIGTAFCLHLKEYFKVLCSLRPGVHMHVYQQETLKPIGRQQTSEGLF
jgi:hypothetical protein